MVEGSIRLDFSEDWLAIKWDDAEFRSRRGHHGKATDVAAVNLSSNDGHLLLIEIKDYPDHPLATVHGPEELATMCADKARDTIAQLLFSSALPEIGRPTEDGMDQLCREFGSTERPLTFVLLVEDANDPPLERLELDAEIERAFRWLPAAAVTAASIEDLDSVVDGLSVSRV